MSLPGGAGGYTRAATGNGVVVLTDGDGAAHTYTTRPGGGYTPPAGEDGVLTRDSAGNLSLAEGDGSIYTFDSSGAPLTSRSALDATHPAAAEYVYDRTVTPARVSTIHDPVSGRDVTLTYGPNPACPAVAGYDAAPANMLCQVSYWDGTSTTLRYKNSQLAAVEEPGAAVTQFGYATGLLATVRDSTVNDWILAGPASRDVPATTTTAIGYTWVAPTDAGGTTNIRPPYVTTDVTAATPGAVPLVTSVTAPAPDGVTAAGQPKHTYTYTGLNQSAVQIAGLPGDAKAVTYDPTGRTLTATSATGQATSGTWDAAGKDLPTSSTDPAGRKSSTIYDWADRATDTFGPAPAACFQANGLPVAAPAASCGTIGHSHTGYDTDTTGARTPGLGARPTTPAVT